MMENQPNRNYSVSLFLPATRQEAELLRSIALLAISYRYRCPVIVDKSGITVGCKVALRNWCVR